MPFYDVLPEVGEGRKLRFEGLPEAKRPRRYTR